MPAPMEQPQYENPEDLIWDTYLKASKDEDEARPKNWEGSTAGTLTFTGLFAATVAAFIVESYKLLSPDPGERTNVLLEHMIIAMANASSQNPVAAPPPELFSASPSAVITNVLWFSSLLITLTCALLSTLVQEWSRNYVQDINQRRILHEELRDRAFNHIYIRMGVNQYAMDQFVSWIVALMHLSVFLFACGLLVFLFPINNIVSGVSTAILGTFSAIYCIASLIPLFGKSCPYRTPISFVMVFVYWLILKGWNTIIRPCFPSRSTADVDGVCQLITRQYADLNRPFLTDSRFQFMWERTYHHINFHTRDTFLRGLPSLIRLHEHRDVLLSHMCANEDLLKKLHQFLVDSYREMRTVVSSSSIDPEIFELLILLSERMYALEVDHHGDDLEDSVLTSSRLLDAIGYVLLIAQVDGASQLSALLCLACVRWSLLELCLKAFERKVPTLGEKELLNFFRQASYNGFRLDNHNPSAILLLFITGYSKGYPWEHTGASILVPLHDGDCCRDWRNAATPEGLAHVAACNALSAIAHTLQSTDSQRTHARSLFPCLHTALKDWDSAFQMFQNERRRAASPEFVLVLRLAGLDEWLEPGSTLDIWSRDSSKHDFLDGTPLGKRCVYALRDLAQHVDFAAYRERRAAATAIPPSSFLQDESCTPTPIPPSIVANTVTLPPPPSSFGANGEVERCDVPGSAWTGPRVSSLPVTEMPLAAEVVRKDMHGTAREGVTTDDGSQSDQDAPVLSALGAERGKHGHGRAPGSGAGELRDREPSARTDRNQASDLASAGRMSAEAQHRESVREHAPDASEDEPATTSPPLQFDGREHERTPTPDVAVLRSVRIDGDHGAQVQTADDIRGIATIPGIPLRAWDGALGPADANATGTDGSGEQLT